MCFDANAFSNRSESTTEIVLLTHTFRYNELSVLYSDQSDLTMKQENTVAGLEENSILYSVLVQSVKADDVNDLGIECKLALRFMLDAINTKTLWAIKGS